MKQEIRTFLDQMFAYEDVECLEPMTLIECAGTLWEWHKDGVKTEGGKNKCMIVKSQRL